MSNKEIAKAFQQLADIMELHDENPFKIRSYQNAYLTIRKLPTPLVEMEVATIESIKGIGSAISSKIQELLASGKISLYARYESMTPPGVREMLGISGFGPKKVNVIWKELGVETVGELLYACNENRLVELKGFGQKTQEDLRQKLEYFQKSQGKYLYADLVKAANQLCTHIQGMLPEAKVSLTGEIRRCSNIVSQIEILVGTENNIERIFDGQHLIMISEQKTYLLAKTINEISVKIYHCTPSDFGSKLFRYTASTEFMNNFMAANEGVDFRGLSMEAEVFTKADLPYIEPELREQTWGLKLAKKNMLPSLIKLGDVKGVIHAHTTYSDGIHTLKEMAIAARNSGFEYIGITDHSKAAFYANGLKEDRLKEQWQEIDTLNVELAPFKIYKGIESDILADGSLDYEPEILQRFDFVIASVHSNLRMDEEKATTRMLKAIENPYTTILGHPTGRLLLSRPGYPLDHKKIIDACAANNVAIELNANPYRLDLDWTWIPFALEKGVLISINPDAHSITGIHDIFFGVQSARKGGLSASRCLTCFNRESFEAIIRNKEHVSAQ
jgi:DNA polymerase (family 10)